MGLGGGGGSYLLKRKTFAFRGDSDLAFDRRAGLKPDSLSSN